MLDKYEWFWPQYIPFLIHLDLIYGVIALNITERSRFSTMVRIIKMTLTTSNAINNPLKRTLASSSVFFKGNLAASSFSNFWNQGPTTTMGEAFPSFCETCENSPCSLLTSIGRIHPFVSEPTPITNTNINQACTFH